MGAPPDKMNKKINIGCKHEEKWCYDFELKEEIINFCEKCYKSLFKKMVRDVLERNEADKLFRKTFGDLMDNNES